MKCIDPDATPQAATNREGHPQREERRSIRLPCDFPVICDLGHRKLPARVLDLSWSGIRVQTERDIPRGTLVRLLFPEGVKGPELPAWTTCRWSREDIDNECYLSGHYFQNGSAAPSRIWVMQVLGLMGKDLKALRERRSIPRYRIEARVVIPEEPNVDCRLRDISSRGACFLAHKRLTIPSREPELRFILSLGLREIHLRADVKNIRKLTDGHFAYHVSWGKYLPESRAIGILLSTLTSGENHR